MTTDALKFFQAYLKEMIDVGGENLPRTISTKLGAKLAKMYKNKGIIHIEKAVKSMYKVLKGKAKIIKIDDKNYEVLLKYSKNFCPIGGRSDPDKVDLFHNSICYPFTIGFLNEFDSKYNYKAEIIDCILFSRKNICHYKLHVEEKDK